MERYRRIKRKKRIKKLKIFLILTLLILMIYGLNIVNKTVKKLSYLDNTNIIHYDLNSNMLDFLGETYIIDFKMLKILKNFLKRPE